MSILLLPIGSDGQSFVDANGAPRSGAQLFVYLANTSTKATLYQNVSGSTTHTNPIVLNSAGQVANGSAAVKPIFITSSQTYDAVLAPSTDTDPPASPYWTLEDISPINDINLSSTSEWISGTTPTYVTATSFTIAGDQTAIYHQGRRLKTTNTGGTIYSTIKSSAYTTLTTVTVINDSGTLDSGLSAVSYSLISGTNTTVPGIISSPIIFQSTVNYGASSGTDTYTATAPQISAYVTGAEYNIKIANANTSTTPTLNLNGLGAKTIVKEGSVALISGDMPANHEAKFRYNGTNMVLLNPRWPSGSVIQTVFFQSGAVGSSAATFPFDDTIPQIGEGAAWQSQAITPKSATSKLKIDVNVLAYNDSAGSFPIIALFRDAGGDALATTQIYASNSNPGLGSITHVLTLASSAATTFYVRYGTSAAGTTYINQNGAAAKFGGTYASTITITEIAP